MTTSPVIRTPTEDDAAGIAGVCNEISRHLYGSGDIDEREARSWFTMPGLGMWVAERDGLIVGYADVRVDDEGRRFPIDIRVPPPLWGTGLTARLLEVAETWAREHAEPSAHARGFPGERDDELRITLEDAGYRLARHSFQMEIELPDRMEPPQWPDGIVVRTYDPARDERRVYEASEEAFEDSWDFRPTPFELWRNFVFERGQEFDPTLWWLAEDDGELAAVCLNAWHFSGDPAFGWIGTLGVRRPWRRRGLGLALLRQSFADFKQRGATRVGLGVDAESPTGAVRLYERAGMRSIRRNDTYDKQLA